MLHPSDRIRKCDARRICIAAGKHQECERDEKAGENLDLYASQVPSNRVWLHKHLSVTFPKSLTRIAAGADSLQLQDNADTERERLRRNRGSCARLMATFSKGAVQIDKILQRSFPNAT